MNRWYDSYHQKKIKLIDQACLMKSMSFYQLSNLEGLFGEADVILPTIQPGQACLVK